MVSNLASEALGYILLIVGLGLLWYRFDWMIALVVGLLIYGSILISGGYILGLFEHFDKKIYKKYEE